MGPSANMPLFCTNNALALHTNYLPNESSPSGTPKDEMIARQKAAYVGAVWSLAKQEGIPQKDASAVVAIKSDSFKALQSGGKNGASLLQGSRAWSNFRSWSKKLGRVEGSKHPAVDNWRALLPKYKGSREYQRPGGELFWVAMANLYEHENQLSLTYSYKLASMACAEKDVEVPSIGAVRHYYEHYADKKAVYIARHGEEAFRNNFAGYITREAPEIDEAWSGDHHIFDAAVKVRDVETGRWKPVRPWLTAWIDWGSLWFSGVCIRTEHPCRDSIERALKSGIEDNQYTPPMRLYVDNGKDYKARGLTRPILNEKDEAVVQSIAEALGCTVHFAIPYNARAKIAERMFRNVCEQFSKLWASYRGSNPQNRPKQADDIWKNPERLPTLPDFIKAFEMWLAKIYHSTESHGRILKGLSPMAARRSAKRLRPKVEPLSLYKAFLRELPGMRKIHRGGVVKALGREYRSEQLWTLMSNETHVRIKIDTDDISVAWIYTKDGVEIGPASAKPVLPAFADDDPKSVEQLRQEQQRHNRQIREAKKASADRRDMSRWLKRPPSPADVAGILPEPQKQLTAPTRKKRRADSQVPEPLHIDAGDIDELDQVLRDQSAERLADQKDLDIDAEDLAILVELEQPGVQEGSWE